MAKRLSEFTESLRQLGEIEVTQWDLMEVLHKDVREFEIGDSLRKLGNTKVTDWELSDVMPAVQRLAHKEVDIAGMVRRTAHYKVIEWDFRDALKSHPAEPRETKRLGKAEKEALRERLRSFLDFTVASLVSDPHSVDVTVREIAPSLFGFRVLVSQKDVKDLIGRGGASGSALRNLLKAAAVHGGVEAVLQIQSHEEAYAAAGHGR